MAARSRANPREAAFRFGLIELAAAIGVGMSRLQPLLAHVHRRIEAGDPIADIVRELHPSISALVRGRIP
jgi:hypothetical protein